MTQCAEEKRDCGTGSKSGDLGLKAPDLKERVWEFQRKEFYEFKD
jgi:hypothetical protein